MEALGSVSAALCVAHGALGLRDRLAKVRLVVGLTHKEIYGRTLLLVCT